MKPQKNPADPDAAVQSNAETVDAQLDSSLVPGPANDTADTEFADCVDLIEQVRRSSPELIDDLLDAGSADAVSDSGVPTKIGRFTIQQQVGSGGFALVFRATDPDLGRDVALKIPRLETLLSQTDRERFLREAQTLSSLAHPNIATVHEAGYAGPVCYLVSAFYRGGTLAQYLRRRDALPPRDAARLIEVLAGAVEHAHRRGVLHRDLKPGNVLFDSDAPSERLQPEDARITDFGLARWITDAPELTRTGALIGTPAYMSPEQADSRHADVSTASDVYALGAMLYQLLAGRPPHQKDSVLASLEAVRTEEPVPPGKLAPGTPRDLEAICLKCLEKTPERRYARAIELADDLRRWLRGEPVTARPVAALERAVRWIKRNPAWSSLAGGLVLAVLAVAVISTFAYFKVNAARGELVERNRDLEMSRAAEAQRARQLRDSLDAQVSIVLEDLLSRQEVLTDDHRKYLQTALDSYEQFVRDEGNTAEAREAVAAAYARVGEINARLGEQAAARTAMLEAIGRYGRLIDHDSDQPAWVYARAKVQTDLARLDTEAENLAAAETRLDEALVQTEALVSDFPDNLDYLKLRANQLNQLGNIQNRSRRLADATVSYRAALGHMKTVVDTAPEDYAQVHDYAVVHGSLAQALFLANEPHEAIELARRAKQMVEALVEQYPERARHRELLGNIVNTLAVFLIRTGRPQEAEPLFVELLEIRRNLFQRFPGKLENQLQFVVACGNVGTANQQKGNVEQAARLWREASLVARRLVEEHPQVPYHQFLFATLQLHLAQYEADRRNVEAALAFAEQGRDGLQTVLKVNPDHPQYRQAEGVLQQVMTDVMSQAGRHAEAAEWAERLATTSFDPAQASFVAARAYTRCAAVANTEKDAELAEQYLKRAVASLQQAVDRGYRDLQAVRDDDEFRLLREQGEVQSILHSVQ